jgi:hypothetical protein
MNIGTKSLLFGAHQFALHPIFTWLGWRRLYGRYFPLYLWIAFVIHDWGYWGMKNMDGKEDNHTFMSCQYLQRGYNWVGQKTYFKLHDLILLHSRFYAMKIGEAPSQLCWADKMGTALMPSRLWAILAHLSGEGYVYMANSKYEIYKKGQPQTVAELVKFHQSYKMWAFGPMMKEVEKWKEKENAMSTL